MPKQTGKGSHKRKEAAFERRATQHHDFVGGADSERAEAEARKREHVEAERKDDTVHQMAEKLEEMAGLKDQAGVLPEFRLPRSLEEGKRLIREAPDALREKARERLEQLPGRAQDAVQIAENLAGLLLAPVRIGFALARELLRVPRSMLRVFRQREA